MKLTELLKKITPLPYRDGGPEGDDPRYILDADSALIADCYADTPLDFGIPSPEEAKANAIYLKHAANVLPKVMEALEQCRNAIMRFNRDGTCTESNIVALGDACTSAVAALAKAENIEL